MLLAGSVLDNFRRHVEHLSVERQLLPRILHALRSFRFLQHGQQAADVAQCVGRLCAHAERHARGGAEQVAEHRDGMTLGVLEK